MPKLIQNNEFISGSPIMDATPQPNSTHAVQSGGVYTAFNNLSTEVSAINSKLGAKGAKLLSIITATGEQDINISDYAFIIIQLTAYGAAYPIGTQIIFDNCTEVGLGKDNGFTSNYGALLSVSFTNNKINLKSIAGTSAQVRIYGIFPK